MSDQTVEESLIGDDATFAEPWQARAFALAVAVTDEGTGRVGTWSEFQERLVEEIKAADSAVDLVKPDGPPALDGDDTEYYRQWLAALEDLLVIEAVDVEDLRERALAFERGDRDAHEFVQGDPHAHVDDLPEGHGDGGHHEHSATGHGDGGHHEHSGKGHSNGGRDGHGEYSQSQ